MIEDTERASVEETRSPDAEISDQPGSSHPPPPTPTIPPPGPPSSDPAFATLAEEHRKLSAELAQCKQELLHSNSKCLELENALATGINLVFGSVHKESIF